MAIDPRRGAGGAGASCRESAAQESLSRQCRADVDAAESRSAGGAGVPTTALIHIGRRVAMAAAVAMLATAVAVCLVLLLAYDRPFAFGGITITPAAFREIMVD
jgi:predicted phage gp36 major capsid-like protein